ncbi:MAG: STAS domain-containing protein, partial [Deltaproteobacteria bacterium]|nr:STAS domain-containing protein [Deltaproteobacteria bacterium]
MATDNQQALIVSLTAPGLYALSGALTAHIDGNAFDNLLKAKTRDPIAFDLSGLTALDLNGAALLLWLKDSLGQKGRSLSFSEPPEPLAPIWNLAQNTLVPSLPKPRDPGFIEEIGLGVLSFVQDLAALTFFLGEILSALSGLIFRPHKIRWALTMTTIEQAVVNALPVTTLVSFLVGLILAFQSAMFMKLFGVDIFV